MSVTLDPRRHRGQPADRPITVDKFRHGGQVGVSAVVRAQGETRAGAGDATSAEGPGAGSRRRGCAWSARREMAWSQQIPSGAVWLPSCRTRAVGVRADQVQVVHRALVLVQAAGEGLGLGDAQAVGGLGTGVAEDEGVEEPARSRRVPAPPAVATAAPAVVFFSMSRPRGRACSRSGPCASGACLKVPRGPCGVVRCVRLQGAPRRGSGISTAARLVRGRTRAIRQRSRCACQASQGSCGTLRHAVVPVSQGSPVRERRPVRCSPRPLRAWEVPPFASLKAPDRPHTGRTWVIRQRGEVPRRASRQGEPWLTRNWQPVADRPPTPGDARQTRVAGTAS
jgi:hypothetical protein